MALDMQVAQDDEESNPKVDSETYDVIIVGAGAAGIGVGIAIAHAGIENFLIVDRDTVGSSFSSWPEETRFITPSFPSNSIGMLDLNSIAIGISPAFSMKVEHPTGKEYAEHLQDIAEYFELPILENTNVDSIEKIDGLFHLKIADSNLLAKNVIWAAGEYQYPLIDGFEGVEFCRHTATVSRYADLEGDNFLIIGGYESGIDAAYHLANNGKKVVLFDINSPWDEESSDPSITLSTFSFERMRNANFENNVRLNAETPVNSVNLIDGKYEVRTKDGQVFNSDSKPLFAGGFDGSHKFVSHLFDEREDGFPLLNDSDESTIVPGMYLCGPSVRHDGHIFCFIFKYRQRFAIVAQAIASSLDIDTDEFVEAYRGWGMYLDDLSCCGQECLTC
tara:strand:+ start:20561 stop:21733 length:1173 start_codon:yes stop_codon:yes gene_type:complete